MNRHEFINGLKILNSIDKPDWMLYGKWERFSRNPFLWLMKADEMDANLIMDEIENRQTREPT